MQTQKGFPFDSALDQRSCFGCTYSCCYCGGVVVVVSLQQQEEKGGERERKSMTRERERERKVVDNNIKREEREKRSLPK